MFGQLLKCARWLPGSHLNISLSSSLSPSRIWIFDKAKTPNHQALSCYFTCCSSLHNSTSLSNRNHENRTTHTYNDRSKTFHKLSHNDTTLLTVCKSNNRLLAHRLFHKSVKNNVNSTKQHFYSPQDLVNAAPYKLQPYLRLMRMDRPIGTWLLYIPCMFSITLATPVGQFPDLTVLALFSMGAFLMRGAGCTINDMWDKDFDSMVTRTQDRPLASGELSYFQALSFLGLQLSGALAILLTFNWYTIILGASSMALVIIYPLMKRITYWPQAFLGVTLNWGVLLSWCAMHGSLQEPSLTLFFSCVVWTMFYDTIYSHQDKEDDIMIGVKSTALKFGDQTKPWLSVFTVGLLSGLMSTGLLCDQHWLYYLGVATFGAQLFHQIYTVNLNSNEDCGKKFRQTRNIGLSLWIFMVAANFLKKDREETT